MMQGSQRRRDRLLRAEKEVPEAGWKGAFAKVRGAPRSCDIMEAGPHCQMPQREETRRRWNEEELWEFSNRKLLVPTETSSSGNGSDEAGEAEVLAQHFPVGCPGAVLWTGPR